MKKSTTLNLSKYAAMVAAAGGIADASGQIIYTDITPDHEGSANSEYMLDIDNDGTNDFKLRNADLAGIYNNLYIDPMNSSNGVMGSQGYFGYAYPFALNSGDAISNAGSWNDNSFQSLNFASCMIGNWCDITDGYLGVRFNIDGATHYGWIRLDVGQIPSSFVVKDYAYNSIADEAITAGQQTLSVGDLSSQNIEIKALNKHIALHNLPENTNYRLFSMTGQSLLNGTIANQTSYSINANTMASGAYILELEDVDSKSVLRKKVIL